jgi:hypothetical protein
MTQKMKSPIDEPLDVSVVEGEVVVLGPDGLHGSFTAQAARASGDRLIEAAGQAEDGSRSPSAWALRAVPPPPERET